MTRQRQRTTKLVNDIQVWLISLETKAESAQRLFVPKALGQTRWPLSVIQAMISLDNLKIVETPVSNRSRSKSKVESSHCSRLFCSRYIVYSKDCPGLKVSDHSDLLPITINKFHIFAISYHWQKIVYEISLLAV